MALFASIVVVIFLDMGVLSLTPCPDLCTCDSQSATCSGRLDLSSGFTKQASIQNVTMRDCDIDIIPAGTFSPFTEIHNIRFENCSIGTVQAGAFHGMRGADKAVTSNDVTMVFSNVSIRHIASGGFGGIRSVHLFLMAQVRVGDVHPEAFSDSELGTVQLSFSNFSRLYPRALAGIRRVSKLYMSYVHLPRGIPCFAFDGIRDAAIYVEFSTLGNICTNAFSGISNTSIDFQTVTIANVETGAFNGSRQVSLLAISLSGIETVGEAIFGDMTSVDGIAGELAMAVISFSGNHVGSLKREAFRGAREFTVFQFFDNHVDCAEDGVFEAIDADEIMKFRNKIPRLRGTCNITSSARACEVCDYSPPDGSTINNSPSRTRLGTIESVLLVTICYLIMT